MHAPISSSLSSPSSSQSHWDDQPGPSTRRSRKQTACTECQRRKQKCVFKSDKRECTNCTKRFPPVECIIINPVVGGVEDESSYERVVPSPGPHQSQAESSRLRGAGKSTARPQGRGAGGRGGGIPLRPSASATTLGRDRLPAGWGSDGGGQQLPPIANPEWLRVDGSVHTESRLQQRRRQTATLSRSGSNLILDGRGDPSTLRPFGGILTEINSLNSLPMPQTVRNMELLHFYLRFVLPNLTSIDGESQPVVFLREVLPWQLQSPVFPSIGLLMASVTQSLDRGLEFEQNPETLAMKAWALSRINQYLNLAEKRTFHLIAPEAIKCVINLVVMEWFWGTDESMMAHVRGVKEMIRLGGGIRAFKEPVIVAIVVLTDYEISCGFEADLYWQDDGPFLADEIPVPTTRPVGFDCPLISSAISFESNKEDLGINQTTANILDDVRFLITSITDLPGGRESIGSSNNSTVKIRSTASWLLGKLERTAPIEEGLRGPLLEEQLILQAVRLSALIQCRCVASLTPISGAAEPSVSDLDELYSTMKKVSLAKWKKTPGIFLWIMLVLCPSTVNDRKGRFIRRKMAVAGLSIGFEDFPLGIAFLRAFWLVQRWIAANRETEISQGAAVAPPA